MKKIATAATGPIAAFFERLPRHERIIADVLRQIILEAKAGYCREKISFSVLFFYHKKGICIIWPASVKGGGIKEGVLLGFWRGNKLNDKAHYLTHGSNKKVYYKTFLSPEEIDDIAINRLLKEAIALDLKS